MSTWADALLTLLPVSPEAVVMLMEGTAIETSSDVGVLAAYALAFARTGRQPEALVAFERLCVLRPDDIEVRCGLAEAAIESARLMRAIEALEVCFKLDPKAETPHGRRARLLAVRLEKKLG